MGKAELLQTTLHIEILYKLEIPKGLTNYISIVLQGENNDG